MTTLSKIEMTMPPQSARPRRRVLIFTSIAALTLMIALTVVPQLLRPRVSDTDGAAKAVDRHTEQRSSDPIFVRFEPLTVKLQSAPDGQESYVQVVTDIRVIDSAGAERAKAYMPELRNMALETLMALSAAQLSTSQGIQSVADDLRGKMNLILDGKPSGNYATKHAAGDNDIVQNVLFESFLIQ